MIDKILGKIGLQRKSKVVQQLDFARSVGKRLDEHRELAESIEKNTSLFTDHPWHVWHMATLDDYLMRLYHMGHNQWPLDQEKRQKTGKHIRSRPAILGVCGLPDIAKNNNGGVFMEKKLTAKDKVDWFFGILLIASFFFCFVLGFSNNPDFKSFLLVSFFTMAVSGVYLVVFYFVARRDHRKRIDKLNTTRKGCGRELLPY